jgi:AcrR family transcriptional regulator
MAHTKERIVETAIAILNRDGADSLSMRTLAKELNIKAASLYWHFESKHTLFCAIAEHMCEGMTVDGASLTSDYEAYREMLLSVRDSVVVFENSHPNTPRRIAIIKSISERLLKLGVKPEHMMTVSNMLNNYVLSFVADEQRFKNTPPEVLEKLLGALGDDERFMFESKRDFDEQFALGLSIVFAGIKAVLQAAS